MQLTHHSEKASGEETDDSVAYAMQIMGVNIVTHRVAGRRPAKPLVMSQLDNEASLYEEASLFERGEFLTLWLAPLRE